MVYLGLKKKSGAGWGGGKGGENSELCIWTGGTGWTSVWELWPRTQASCYSQPWHAGSKRTSAIGSCVKVEVDVLCSPSQIVGAVSVDVKQH